MERILIGALLFCGTTCLAQQVNWGEWNSWGEQSDGTYLNPIIPSDYSDIDCIRVGDDYYAISSTFQFSPGMTILHSRDLVNWEIVGNAVADLTQISEELDYTRMNRYGRGIWAGTLRHHAGRFHLFFGTPDEGFFTTWADRAEGPWSPLTCLLAAKGWDDCTAFWDERTGRAWFAGTHFADGYKSYLFPMADDGTSIDFEKRLLINEGSGREASKIIRHGDYYYLIFSEHKGGIGRYVMGKRTRRLEQGFAEERQLAVASTQANEPNQGGIVEAPDGQDYFLTHHGTGDWSGRIVSLLPVTWVNGWPLIGSVRADGMGEMAWRGTMPLRHDADSVATVSLTIHRSDDFDSLGLAPQWQWNYQPRHDKFSLAERPGWLRLHAFAPLEHNRLMTAGNTLTARVFRSRQSCVTIKLDLSALCDGQRCGLCHFSASHSALGVAQEEGQRYIEFRENDKTERGARLVGNHLWLRSEWGMDGRSQYSYSTDGDHFIPFGKYQLQWGNYRGDRYGIYCFNNRTDCGHVDVDYCHYEMKAK